MTNETPSTTINTFCVWADYIRRMYQHVEADSPQSAYEIAKASGAWEPCDIHDNNGYRVSDEVQNLETEEFVAVHGASHCKTCGSEIVDTINDSAFRHGECDACEFRRYQSQPELLQLARTFKSACDERISILDEIRDEMYADTEDIDDQLGHWKVLRRKCKEIIEKSTSGDLPER